MKSKQRLSPVQESIERSSGSCPETRLSQETGVEEDCPGVHQNAWQFACLQVSVRKLSLLSRRGRGYGHGQRAQLTLAKTFEGILRTRPLSFPFLVLLIKITSLFSHPHLILECLSLLLDTCLSTFILMHFSGHVFEVFFFFFLFFFCQRELWC